MHTEPPLLSLDGVSKTFPGVRALTDVDLAVGVGEIVSLVGQNGAGKSTLMSIIGGIYLPDTGTVSVAGSVVKIASPAVAESLGIGFVHQEPTLVSNMSVAANIFLRRERTRRGLLDFKTMREVSSRTISTLGFEIDPDRLVGQLSLVEKEVVEIARAMLLEPRILILDEVTAPLDADAVERLFELVESLRRRGIAIIFISHRLDEVVRISDRIVVLRDGAKVADIAVDESVTGREIIAGMVGHDAPGVAGVADAGVETPADDSSRGLPHLSVQRLSLAPHYDNVSFDLARGEILGFAGLKGSGITEMLKTLFGAKRPHAGTISLDGRALKLVAPADAISNGIGMLTNDRQHEGLALTRNLIENITVSTMQALRSRARLLRRREARSRTAALVTTLEIKTPSLEQYALNLSGGNQQKVVLAKWVLRNLDVLIADEPTRGVDVRAKDEIYKLFVGLKHDGKAIIIHSPEVPELLAVCDRIIVIGNGRLVDEVRSGTPEFNVRHVLEQMHSSGIAAEPAVVR